MTVEYRRVDVFSAENREVLPIYPLDVFRTTEKGETEIQSGATTLTAEMLELLVAVDGKANVGDLEQQLQHLKPEVLRNVLRALMSEGCIRQPTVEEEMGLDLTSFFASTAPAAAIKWPIMLLMLLIGMCLARSPKTTFTARVSMESFSLVPVPCALM